MNVMFRCVKDDSRIPKSLKPSVKLGRERVFSSYLHLIIGSRAIPIRLDTSYIKSDEMATTYL